MNQVAAQDGQLGARVADGLLGALDLGLAAAGEEHDAPGAAADRQLGERADDVDRAGDREVGRSS